MSKPRKKISTLRSLRRSKFPYGSIIKYSTEEKNGIVVTVRVFWDVWLYRLCPNELRSVSEAELVLLLAAAVSLERAFLQLKLFRKERVLEYSISISCNSRTVAYRRTLAYRRIVPYRRTSLQKNSSLRKNSSLQTNSSLQKN